MRELITQIAETTTNVMQWSRKRDATDRREQRRDEREDEAVPRPDGAGRGDHDHDQSNIGILCHTNTLSNDLAKEGHLRAAFDTFNLRLPVEQIGDIPFQRNLTRIERTLPLLEPDLEEAMLRLTKETDFIMSPSTVGTGFIAFRWADLGPQFDDTIDVVITASETSPDTLQQKAQNAILAGVGHGMIEPPVLLCDHRAGEIRFQDVAPEIAHALVANAHTDLINRGVGYWTMSYQHIPLGGLSDMEVSETIRNVVDEASPWFSTQRWCPWADQSMSVPLAAEADSYVILPTGVDLGQNEDIQISYRPGVSGAHVINFWPLERGWVEQHVRRAGVEFVDQQIRAGDNRIATVWADHAAPRDPVEEWDRLRAAYIDPRLPEE